MLHNSHALIKREWISNKDNKEQVTTTEGCMVDFSMDDSPIVNQNDYTLQEEYILFQGVKIHFLFTQENNHLILNDNDLDILIEKEKLTQLKRKKY